MLRPACLALAVLAAGQAGAQDADFGPGAGEPAIAAPANGEVDFILRPTQSPDDDFWINQLADGLSGAIGPPLRGPAVAVPNGDRPIGPPMAGPVPPERPRPVARPRPDGADPFDPTGVRVGRFILRPAIEIGVRATDNVAGGRDEEAAVGLIIAPELNIHAEDDRYELDADLRSEMILYGDEEFDDRESAARVAARYELTSRTSLNAAAAYSTDQDSYTDPDTPDAAVERPAVHDMQASLGVTQRFGRLGVGLSALVERELYEEVALAGGGTASREDLDNTEYGLRLTTSYQASGVMRPFADIAAGRREYDIEVDSDGFARSGVWGELRGGLVFDLGSRLNGEVALGYRREEIDDDDLDDLDALIADASILWSPRRLTELRFYFATETRPTGIPGASSSVEYSGGVAAERRIGARWRVEGGLGLDYEFYVGADRRDVTGAAYAGLSYALSRYASLSARYSYERTESSDPDGDEDENAVSVRLRIQR